MIGSSEAVRPPSWLHPLADQYRDRLVYWLDRLEPLTWPNGRILLVDRMAAHLRAILDSRPAPSPALAGQVREALMLLDHIRPSRKWERELVGELRAVLLEGCLTIDGVDKEP